MKHVGWLTDKIVDDTIWDDSVVDIEAVRRHERALECRAGIRIERIPKGGLPDDLQGHEIGEAGVVDVTRDIPRPQVTGERVVFPGYEKLPLSGRGDTDCALQICDFWDSGEVRRGDEIFRL